MITGYFYSDTTKKHCQILQIKKILKLLILANIVYLVWKCFYSVITHNTDFFQNIFTLKSFLGFILLNESPLNGHLWYLGAILYVLTIVLITDKLNCSKLLYWLIPVLLFSDLVLGKYSIVIWGREFPYILVRNFLFVGIPYFCIGHLIRNGFGNIISKSVSGGLIVLFSLTSLLEHFILVSIDMNATRDHYISTTLLAVVVFIFALKCGNNFNNENIANKMNCRLHVIGLLAVIGRKYSTWLYILHPIFITCIDVLMKKVGLYGFYSFCAPFVVYTVTLVFLVFLNKCRSKIINIWK